MMTKKAFVKFINELNESSPRSVEGFKKEIDGKIYQLFPLDSQMWHDEIADGKEYYTNHTLYQLAHHTKKDPTRKECNWYALRMADEVDGDMYMHKLIPMTKTTTYHPEVIIPPHEEEHYIFI
ncbi:hypothetical protein [Holdemanella porci]|uniref:hypothetical protein n=1 Tax=Holdemanella porci TaxID=2652276 RepID=UPI003AB37702